MHNTWTELLLTLNDSGATHFCVAPTARKGASLDLTLAALGKIGKIAARGVRFKSGLWKALHVIHMSSSERSKGLLVRYHTRSYWCLYHIVCISRLKTMRDNIWFNHGDYDGRRFETSNKCRGCGCFESGSTTGYTEWAINNASYWLAVPLNVSVVFSTVGCVGPYFGALPVII